MSKRGTANAFSGLSSEFYVMFAGALMNRAGVDGNNAAVTITGAMGF
jgi:hypothetical protein